MTPAYVVRVKWSRSEGQYQENAADPECFCVCILIDPVSLPRAFRKGRKREKKFFHKPQESSGVTVRRS